MADILEIILLTSFKPPMTTDGDKFIFAFQILQALIQSNANLHLADNRGQTPLSIACKQGHLKAVKLLLGSGSDSNHQDESGVTPIALAAENGHVKVVDCLVNAHANVNLPDSAGVTPLSRACSDDKLLPVVRLLLQV